MVRLVKCIDGKTLSSLLKNAWPVVVPWIAA